MAKAPLLKISEFGVGGWGIEKKNFPVWAAIKPLASHVRVGTILLGVEDYDAGLVFHYMKCVP